MRLLSFKRFPILGVPQIILNNLMANALTHAFEMFFKLLIGFPSLVLYSFKHLLSPSPYLCRSPGPSEITNVSLCLPFTYKPTLRFTLHNVSVSQPHILKCQNLRTLCFIDSHIGPSNFELTAASYKQFVCLLPHSKNPW